MKYASQNTEMTASDIPAQRYLLKRLVLPYANAHKKKHKINFIYSGNKEICRIFRTSSVKFYTKCHSFHLFFFCSNNIFLINHMLKFKNQPDQMQLK